MDKSWFNIDLSLSYFKKQIDSQGIIQFTIKDQKDYQNGYAIEDQARGLLVALELNDSQLTDLFVSLLKVCKDDQGVKMLWDQNGNFQSKVDNYGEASAETIWALGTYLAKYPDQQAKELVDHLTKGVINSHFPRVWTYALLGLVQIKDIEHTTILADKLITAFDQQSDNQWQWFEDHMTYANALFPWALLASYQLTKNSQYKEIGLKSLNFLLDHLIANEVPIVVGNKGWWQKGHQPEIYDQQPIDISYLVLACLYAHQITDQQLYLDKALFYYSWFFGNNLNNVLMIRPDGGCHDGLNEDGPNPNAGAESTICFLLACIGLKSNLHLLASNSYKTLAI